MNWKGCERKWSWPNLRHLPVRTKENHDKPQPGLLVSGPRLEPGTSRIKSRHDTQSKPELKANKSIWDLQQKLQHSIIHFNISSLDSLITPPE
jgi:hypothetical protein